jgi:putative ABC transport system permease protein
MSGVLPLAGAGLKGRRRGGLAATFLVLVLASVGIAAGLVVSGQGAPLLDRVAAEADVAHLVVKGREAAVVAVAGDPEVRASSGPFATVDDAVLVVDDEEIAMELMAVDDLDIAVNRPPQRAGRWAQRPDEIVLDRSLAADVGLGVGDTVTLRSDADATYTVVGTAVNLTDCFYPQCDPGRAWLTEAGLDRLAPGDRVFAQAWLRFDEPEQADPFVQRQAAAGVTGIGGTESWLDTRDDFLAFDRVFGAFVTAFGMFVLVVAAVVVAGSMAVRMVARRREIGLLGAVGCTPRQITGALLLEHLVVGVGAAGTGWFLGGFLTPVLQIGIGAALGPQDPAWTLPSLVVTLAVVLGLLTVATLVPARSASRRPVTDVLRDVPPEPVSRLSRRASGVPRRLSLLGAQDVASRPTRGVLAALAIAVAVVGTIVSLGFVQAVGEVAADPARAGDPWDVTVIAVDGPLDPDAVGAVDGVATWFSEVSRRSTLQDGAFLSMAIGGDPSTAGFRIAGGRAMATAGEAIAGYGFLHRFDVAVGDQVRFLAGTTPIDVTVVGWYRETEDTGEVLLYRLETLTAADPTAVPGVVRATAAAGTDPAALGARIADALGPAVRVEVIDTGTDDLDAMTAVLRLVALLLLVMAVANLLTTLLTSTRESARRIGVQQAVGFTPRQLVGEGAVAGAVLGLLAVVVGVPLGLVMFRLLSDLVSEAVGVGPGWMAAPALASVAVLALVAVAVAAAVGALASARLARRPAAELLRWE